MGSENVDYDKQFEEDLKRAEALSLESLAFEQFQKQKRLQEMTKYKEQSMKSKSTSVSRTSSITEKDCPATKAEKHLIKSRPRPEIGSSSQGNPLIAPPPMQQRKLGTSSTTQDLISFTQPPPNSTAIELCQQINNLAIVQPVSHGAHAPRGGTAAAAAGGMGIMRSTSLVQPSAAQSPLALLNHFYGGGNSATPSKNYGAQTVRSESTPTMLQHLQQKQSMVAPTSSIDWNRILHRQAPPIDSPRPVSMPKSLPLNATVSLLATSPFNGGSTAAATSKGAQVPQTVTPKTHKQFGHRRNNSNLIDLASCNQEDRNSVRVSILEAFDPLLNESAASGLYNLGSSASSDYPDDVDSVCGSVYDEYDPYDFINVGVGSNSLSDPIYAAVVKSENAPLSPPPPLPPRAQQSTLERRRESRGSRIGQKLLLYENIVPAKQMREGKDSDLRAFHRKVQKLRNQFKYDDPDTNMGLVMSPFMHHEYPSGTSIKLNIYPHYEGADSTKPVTFTCDVTSSVEHITLHVTYELEAPTADQYTLKVWGHNEYLAPTTLLSDYEYVHTCIKLEEDVLLILLPDRLVDRSLARTAQDDVRDREIHFEDVVPNDPVFVISHDGLKILLETLENEMAKLQSAAAQIEMKATPNVMPQLQTSAVLQSVKMVVQILGSVETLEVTEALLSLSDCCKNFLSTPLNWKTTILEMINNSCDKIRIAVLGLLEMYSQAFPVNFELIKDHSVDPQTSPSVCVGEVSDPVLVRVCTLHRPSPEWKHDDYRIAVQVYHGTRPIGLPVLSQPSAITVNLYTHILFDCWLELVDVPVSSLAREARLVFVIYGRTLQQRDQKESDDSSPQYKQEELGWAAVQFFNYDGVMVQGSTLLSIWPKDLNHIYGPAPSAGTYPFSDHPLLHIEFSPLPRVVFPPIVPSNAPSNAAKADFASLDLQTQQQLIEICEQDMLFRAPTEVREILWEKRHYLYGIPAALPKVLLAAHSWAWSLLDDLHGMLKCWKPLLPVQALQLLLPTFPDIEVRKLAVKWIGGISSDELIDYLPQLVVALRHETFEDSELTLFLLGRSLKSPRVAHHLFWLLSHNLPGTIPQNYSIENNERDVISIGETRYHRRITLLLRALLAICGESLRKCFISQQLLVKELNDIAINVQKTKESQRLNVMCNSLDGVHHMLVDMPTSLPLSPTLQVSGIQVRSCSYFPSNTLPLKINFLAKDGSVIPAIYKVGDDLQQDQLTLQIVRIMDKLWLREGVDLKMVTFACVPTGKRKGMIEMVNKAETLRKIQVEHGLTGSFKDKPIYEWLAKHNPSELEYGRAVENFTASCAGYCVVTYVLGICDRHNDNIMLKPSGHLFHIDFGKFLGDAQMFGNFKRDRTPFVLTSDMAFVINGCDRPSAKFHQFVDLCCQAFNIVRNNTNLFLHLFTLMASSGIQGVTTEAVSNLHKALLPGQSNPEAAAYFARLIESSLKSWFTQVNFFLHNLAQLKFTGDHGDNQLLSFVPKTYSVISDGRLIHVSVIGYRKRYDPDKYYVYILRVERENQAQYLDVLRTYKEFSELQQKLCLQFPLAKLHSLSTGLHMGRSNIKQVAAKRFHDVSLFVQSLFQCADEIAHSDLVYTFFHPLLRDQQTVEQFTRKIKDRRIEDRSGIGRLKGQLKLSLQFNRGVFCVMVYHVRGLPLVGNGQEPSTYVKVYLQPDPTKTTKRKTKVVKRNCHPSFMEMLEYRMSLDVIKHRILRATVWNHDPLQENEFLGGVELDLSQFDLAKEMCEWFPLTNLSR